MKLLTFTLVMFLSEPTTPPLVPRRLPRPVASLLTSPLLLTWPNSGAGAFIPLLDPNALKVPRSLHECLPAFTRLNTPLVALGTNGAKSIVRKCTFLSKPQSIALSSFPPSLLPVSV